MSPDRGLERRLLWIVKLGVIGSGLALAGGLLLHVMQPGRPRSTSLLALGLILLMATPVTRVMIAMAERIRRRDWQFVVFTALVLIELTITMWLAMKRV